MLWLFLGKEFHVPRNSFRRKSDKKEIGGLGKGGVKGEEEGFYGGGDNKLKLSATRLRKNEGGARWKMSTYGWGKNMYVSGIGRWFFFAMEHSKSHI